MEENSIYCVSCGARNTSNNNFCSNCGAKLGNVNYDRSNWQNEVSTNDTNVRKDNWVIPLISFLWPLIGVIICLYLKFRKGSTPLDQQNSKIALKWSLISIAIGFVITTIYVIIAFVVFSNKANII